MKQTHTFFLIAIGSLPLMVASSNAAVIIDGVNLGTNFTVSSTSTPGATALQLGTASLTTGDTLTLSSTANGLIGQLGSSTVDINGGSFVVDRIINIGNGTGGNAIITITDGIADFNDLTRIGRDGADGLLTISGGAVDISGTLIFDELGGNGTINFTTGSTGTLTVAGEDLAGFQALYTAGDITLNGSNSAAFATVFQVSGSTLSVVPEPSSAALLGLGGLALILRRRK